MLCGLSRPAPGAPGEADARHLAELLRAGADAASAKRWDDCARALTDAAALDDAAKTWGDLGLCEEQAGHYALAHTHLRRAMESAPAQPTREPWTRYGAALARVKERVALLLITTYPPNAKVIIDGRPVGVADGRSFAVEPGKHTIAARLEGYEDKIEPREVRARDVPSIYLRLDPKPQATAASPPSPRPRAEPSPPPPRPLEGAPVWPLFLPGLTPRGFLVGLSLAGVALVQASATTGIGFELDRASLRSRVDRTACGPANPSPPALCSTLLERGKQRDAAMTLAAGAAITTGVLFVASGLAIGQEWRTARPSIAPMVTDHGGWIAVGGVW
jgi:hypothetical protein